jgi:hypothetical protein
MIFARQSFVNRGASETSRTRFGKKIVASVMPQLTWTHIIQILPLKDEQAKLYYLAEAAKNALSVTGAA